MALISGNTTVGTSATLIDGIAWNNPVLLHIHNDDNTTSVHVGGSDVTTSNGLELLKQDSLEITLHQANQIYCVSSKSGHVVSWIAQKI
jgi:glutamine cyclotransferase